MRTQGYSQQLYVLGKLNLKTLFRPDYIEYVNSIIVSQKSSNSKNINKNYSNISQTTNNKPKFYIKRLTFRSILTSKEFHNKLFVLFFKRFQDYGYVIEEKKHYFYIEKLIYLKENLDLILRETNLSENFKEVVRDYLDYFISLYNSQDLPLQKSQKGFFIPCLNSQFYKFNNFEIQDKVCPLCLLKELNLTKFDIFHYNRDKNYGFEEIIDKYEDEKNVRFTEKEREILNLLSDITRIVYTLTSDLFITITNTYIPAVGYIENFTEDNDITNIRNYKMYILQFSNDQELMMLIEPIRNFLNNKLVRSLSDIDKLAIVFRVDVENQRIIFETENGEIGELEENDNIFIDQDVDNLIEEIINYSKEELGLKNIDPYNNIFTKFYEEFTFKDFYNLVFNKQKFEPILNEVSTNLIDKVLNLIESLKEEIRYKKDLID